ncbi:hypothetical protein HJC23_004998 [Cyclotella cryptica]|uniref:Uncharacterized protein n=1 Tax=Cyclotella cryptica TaxID=29204 RepID=A0ABD3QKU7_9STRA
MLDEDHAPSELSSRDAMFGAFQFYEKDPMSSISSFVCNSCDVEGTSRYLLEYFEIFHAMKKAFYSRSITEDSSVRQERMSECVESRVGNGFLLHMTKIHAIESQQNELKTCNERFEKGNESKTLGDCVRSEIHISHMTNVLRLLSKQLPPDTQKCSPSENESKVTVSVGSATASEKSSKEESDLRTASRTKKARKESRSTGYSEHNFNAECASNQAVSVHPTSEIDFDAVYQNKVKLDPTYLVGMPLQIFNPVDNSYHSGRIVQCKMNAPFKVDESHIDSKIIGKLIDKDISNTMYLVRFREGVDGRKVNVHQWLYLEEHAVIVGAEVCWAKISLATDPSVACAPSPLLMSPYRPVQIVFRSMLEMISVCKYAGSSDGASLTNVLARGFGDVFSFVRVTLQENDNSPQECSNALAQSAECNPKLRASDDASGFGLDYSKVDNIKPRPNVFPFRIRDPLWLNEILRRVRLTDEDVGVAVAMACVEKNEKGMIRSSQNLEN